MEPENLAIFAGRISFHDMISECGDYKGCTRKQGDFMAIYERITFSFQNIEAFLVIMLLRCMICIVSIKRYSHATAVYTTLIFI